MLLIKASSQNQLIKEHINKLRRKCAECELEIKRSTKQLKVNKKKQANCSTSKEKARCDLVKKKHLKRKKKLEKKYAAYKSRLVGLMSRQSQNSESTEAAKHRARHKEASARHRKHQERRGKHHRASAIKERSTRRLHTKLDEANEEAPTGTGTANQKMPYPVLNDKRELKVILNILKEKQNHLNEMLEQTLATLESLKQEKNTANQEDIEAKHTRLKNLEENIKVQLTRLNRQIDYINFSLDIAKIKKMLLKTEAIDEAGNMNNESDLETEQVERLKKKLADLNKKVDHLLTLMKDANRRFQKQQEQLKQQQAAKTESQKSGDAAANTNAPGVPISYYRNVPPPIMSNNNSTNASSSGGGGGTVTSAVTISKKPVPNNLAPPLPPMPPLPPQSGSPALSSLHQATIGGLNPSMTKSISQQSFLSHSAEASNKHFNTLHSTADHQLANMSKHYG